MPHQQRTSRLMSAPLSVIHESRVQKGRLRQPSFQNDLIELDRNLKSAGADHAYRLNLMQIQILMTLPGFKNGGAGQPVTLPTTQYIYRICPIGKLLSYTTGWTSTAPRKEDHAWVAFRLWERQVGGTNS